MDPERSPFTKVGLEGVWSICMVSPSIGEKYERQEFAITTYDTL